MTMSISRRSLVLFLAGLVAVLATACFKSGPEALVEKYFSAINSGQIEEAMALLSDRTLDRTSRDKVKAALSLHSQQMQAAGGIDGIKVLSAEIAEDHGIVKIELTLGNGNKGVQDIAVVYEKGQWRLGNN